jgi:NAD(P)-dependent dehydrogenase (short-subunit alcohol dehydrogenase family)
VQKAGVRNLVHSLDTTLEPDGIRAVSVTVRGTLSREGPFTPYRVADALWSAVHQDEADWRTEVPYDG